MSLILIIVLLVILFGGSGYGWHTSGYAGGPYLGGGVGLILVMLVLWLILGGRL